MRAPDSHPGKGVEHEPSVVENLIGGAVRIQLLDDVVVVGGDGGEDVVHALDQRAGESPSCFARSRRTNFWILPVEVFGSGPNTTVLGTLKWARLSRHQAMMLWADRLSA